MSILTRSDNTEAEFPGSAADGDVVFHKDKVFLYHKATNTWECRTIEVGNYAITPDLVEVNSKLRTRLNKIDYEEQGKRRSV